MTVWHALKESQYCFAASRSVLWHRHCTGRHATLLFPSILKKTRSIYDKRDVTSVQKRTRIAAVGRIDIIIGPMFSGKTSTLVERIDALEQNMNPPPKILILKSDKDARYSASHIVTHTGVQKPCHALSSLHDVYTTVGEEYDSSRIVAIDEAQFFGSELIEFCSKAADEHHKHVIVAGLDGDFMRNKFGFILDMIPLADSVVKLTASCRYCDEEAVFSLRLTDSVEQEEVGGSERYVATCRKHFLSRTR